MIKDIKIRESAPNDIAAVEGLYPDAFPDEDLLPLVSDLLDDNPSVLSLVAIVDGALAGHACFTKCTIAGKTDGVALLGPVAVAPASHAKGIGSALIRDGFAWLKNAHIIQIFVLGDPAYYRRFGFMPEIDVMPPYPLPEEWRGAWQSVSLLDANERPRGTLSVPQPWHQPALWVP